MATWGVVAKHHNLDMICEYKVCQGIGKLFLLLWNSRLIAGEIKEIDKAASLWTVFQTAYLSFLSSLVASVVYSETRSQRPVRKVFITNVQLSFLLLTFNYNVKMFWSLHYSLFKIPFIQERKGKLSHTFISLRKVLACCLAKLWTSVQTRHELSNQTDSIKPKALKVER